MDGGRVSIVPGPSDPARDHLVNARNTRTFGSSLRAIRVLACKESVDPSEADPSEASDALRMRRVGACMERVKLAHLLPLAQLGDALALLLQVGRARLRLGRARHLLPRVALLA